MILGIDLGNVNVKTSTREIFQNRSTTDRKLYEEEENLRVEMDGQKYVIGAGEYQTDYRKVSKTSTLLNLYTAIALSSQDVVNHVVVGLPVQQFKTDKDEMEQLISLNNAKELILNGRSRKVIISDCRCFPESLAAYFSLSPDAKVEIGSRDVVVVDIGGRTTDICLYAFQRGKRKLANYVTIPAGTLNIYSDFIQAINTKYGLDLLKEEAQTVLSNGLWVDGEKVPLQFTREVFQRYTDRILSELRLNYPIRTGKTILCGGGALLLKGLLQREIKGTMVIEDIFCNAIGFRRVGESIWNLSR